MSGNGSVRTASNPARAKGGAWGAYLARWAQAYCPFSHHQLLRNVFQINLFLAVTCVTKLSG